MKELVVSILEIFTVAGFASCGQQRVTDTGSVSESQTAKVLSVAHAPQGKSFYSDRIFLDSFRSSKLMGISQDYQTLQKLKDSSSCDEERPFLFSDEELHEIVAQTQREITID